MNRPQGHSVVTSELEPLLIRVEDVAFLLSIGRSKAYEMIARNELPGIVRIGRSVRVLKQALVAWIDRQVAESIRDDRQEVHRLHRLRQGAGS